LDDSESTQNLLFSAKTRVTLAVKKFIHGKNANQFARKRKDRRRNLACIRKPIVQGHGGRDNQRHRHDMEFIFDSEFVKWGETFSGMTVQAAGLNKYVIYNWRKNWLANHSWRPWNYSVHGRQHRILIDDDEETSINKFIMSNYLIPDNFLLAECFTISPSRHF
jgi:hypothetical protein